MALMYTDLVDGHDSASVSSSGGEENDRWFEPHHNTISTSAEAADSSNTNQRLPRKRISLKPLVLSSGKSSARNVSIKVKEASIRLFQFHQHRSNLRAIWKT
ncbi:hypothetical protein TorRG33x02_178750 [Trema orientale]|uniref:Uncharacterized protein n=1 Tax=Trema orientale TaxID=63057 RepID=A0A2P5ELC5_TREOI|nr:hypothetical protein TorRG33x02_178750 [Trema orientale]